MKILVVEDEKEMARLVTALLRHSGFKTEVVSSIDCALEAVRQSPYELLLLDRRLPDGDGMSMLAEVRKMRPGIRVIMLTALDSLGEKVSGLDGGADDYLTKPFQRDELLARIRACLRRPGGESRPPVAIGPLVYDLQTNDVLVHGSRVELPRRELMLLRSLMQRVNRVTSRKSLIDEIYGFEQDVMGAALDTSVSRLRRKLSELNVPIKVHTVRGRGYMLMEARS